MGVIRTRAAMVLKLMDLYTGEAADIRKIHIQVAQGNRALKKSEGCVVILEETGMGRIDVSIEGHGFCRNSLSLKPEEKNRTQYHYVWLQPQKGYPYAMGTTFLTGTSGLERFELAVENRDKPLRLLVDYKQGADTIQISNMPEELIGRRWLITGGSGGKAGEIFELSGQEEKRWSYRLAEALKHDYKRDKAEVARLLPVETCAGRFYVGISGIAKEGTEIGVYREGKFVKKIFAEYGKENCFEI